MKIVVTNDDGFDQPGLTALVEVIAPLGEVTVVAPATQQSNVGHQVTMKTPIRVDRRNRNTYVVHGTPADCSRLALKLFVPDADWIIAGINPGANLGSDVHQSGTVAAAREAAILGVRALAVSQYIAPGWIVDWRAARAQISRWLPDLMHQPLSRGRFWNVNLPSPITPACKPAQRLCPLDKHPHDYHYSEGVGGYRYEGVIHNRPRSAGSDVAVCFSGMIAITLLEV